METIVPTVGDYARVLKYIRCADQTIPPLERAWYILRPEICSVINKHPRVALGCTENPLSWSHRDERYMDGVMNRRGIAVAVRRMYDPPPLPSEGEIHSLVDSNRTDGEDDDWPRFRECEWNWHCFWIPSPEVRTSRFECPIPSTRSACDSDPEELKRKDTYAMRREALDGTRMLWDSSVSTDRFPSPPPVTARTVIIYVTGNYGSCETIDDIASELSCMASTVEVAHGNSAAKATFTLKPPVESDRFVECLLQTYKFDYYGLRDDTNTLVALH